MEDAPKKDPRADNGLRTRWKKGQSGNPSGTRSAGAIIKWHINALAEKELTEEQLRVVARDPKQPWPRRCAAERILRSLEAGDMADFEPYLNDGESLTSLRGKGLNTEVVKKAKQKRREIPQEGGAPIVEIEREIELHNRAGDDFDRIMDRTEGKPAQAITGADGGPLVTELRVHFDE